MTTFPIRLFKFLRQQSALTKTILNKVNFEKDHRQFLNYQTLFLIQFKLNYSVSSNIQINIHQESDIDKKMITLNREEIDYGVTKFNICDVLNNMKESETISSLEGLFFLRCCSELIFIKSPQVRLDLGNKIWKLLNESGNQLEVSHYNALLDLYLETNYQFSPFDILWQMLNNGVEPNQDTFVKLISYFCNNGKIEEATRILKYMEDMQLAVTEDILSNFIFAHCINDDMDGTTNILKKMESLNIPTTSSTYSAFMCAFARKGDLESIKKYLNECKNNDIEISEKIFSKIIYELCMNDFPEKLHQILSLLPQDINTVRESYNLIRKLIEEGKEEEAFKIFEYLSSNINGENEVGSNFFIRSLIIYNTPVEKSIVFCRNMEEKGINRLAFLSAINKSIENHRYEMSFSFMKAWKELGGSIKENTFYPILKAYSNSKYGDINTIVQKMILEFEVYPSIFMITTYILPYLKGDAEEVLSILINNHINKFTAVNAVILQLLSDNKIREAVNLMSKYHIFSYNFEMFKYNILQAFKNTYDISSIVWILHYLYNSVLSNKIDMETYQQFVDLFALEIFNYLYENNKYMLLMFFSNLIDKGISVSPEVVGKMEKKLDDKMKPEILSVLNTLKSDKSVSTYIFKQYGSHWAKLLMNIEKFENVAEQISETNPKINVQIKNDILIYYCTVKNEKKVCELIEEFNNSNMIMTIDAINSLSVMYADMKKVSESEFWLNKMKEKIPNFRIRQKLCLQVATALVNNDCIDKALEYLRWPNYSTTNCIPYCTEILNAVLKYDNENLLHQFFEILSANGYLNKLNNDLLAPFIQLHLNRNDREAALKKFEWIYDNYKLIPLPMELMKQFIIDDNEQKLEKIHNIFNRIGKKDFFFKLAMAYLENNETSKAKNIILNHCTYLYEEYVILYAEEKYKLGQVEHLEKLFTIFSDLQYDVDLICVLLLKSYSAKKQWDKCYNLWMTMQKKNINISFTFIDCLNSIMIEKHMNKNDTLLTFNTAVKNCDYKEAEKLLPSIPLIYKTDCYSTLCKEYIRKNQFSKAIELWENLNFNYNLNINLTTAELFLKKMLQQRDFQNIEKIEEFINPKFKHQLNYNYYLNQAYLQSGCWNLYLKNLECKLNEGKVTSNNINLHVKTAVNSLLEYPEMFKNYASIAYRFAENNILEPITALWIYYFLQKNPIAEEIWLKFLKNSTLSLWLEAINFSQSLNDPDLYVQLAKQVNESPIKRANQLISNQRLIKKCLLLNDPRKYECGLKCLQHAMVNFSMDEIGISLLAELQQGLETCGIAWPWTVEQKKRNGRILQKVIDGLSK